MSRSVSITPALRELLARKKRAADEEVEHDRNGVARTNRVVAAITGAAERLDSDFSSPTRWKPSEIIALGYFIILTAGTPGCRNRAEEFVRERLAK